MNRCAQYSGKHGFSLIVSLAIMGFVLLLMLSLSALVQLETTVAVQTTNMSHARQDALFGLNTALAQLQKLTGPDQRVTAPAGISADVVDGKANWTGVWESSPDNGPAQNFQGWLVSLPDGQSNDQASIEATDIAWSRDSRGWMPDNNDWILLVGSGSVEVKDSPANHVAAGKVSISNTDSFAYWIGEEGTKARVNLPAPPIDRENIMAPAHTGFTQLDQAVFAGQDQASGEYARMNSLENLDMLLSVDDVDKRYFHSLSTYGRSVLADVKNGGLKQDLTHLLENDAAFTRTFGGEWDARYMFVPDGARISFNHGCPNWGIMRAFYQLSDAVVDGKISPIEPNPHSKGTHVWSYRESGDDYQQNQPVHAIVSQLRLVLGFRYIEGSDGVYRPRLLIKPLLALYNPYDIPLNATEYSIEWSFKPLIKVQIDGQSEVQFRLHEVLPPYSTSSNDKTRLRWTIQQDNDLRAGETRYYSMSSLRHLTSTFFNGAMHGDWSEDGAYFVDITTDGDLIEATSDGYTTTEYTANSHRANYGLTVNEKSELEFNPTTSVGTTLPYITITISYDGTDASGESTDGAPGRIELKVNSTDTEDIGQLFDKYYQDISATKLPQEDTSSFFLADLTGSHGQDISAIAFGLDVTEQTADPQRQLIEANPRAIIFSGWEDGAVEDQGRNTVSGWTYDDYTGKLLEPQINLASGRYNGFWGNSRERYGAESVVLFHVPREPLISLGAFQHANLGRYSRHPAYIAANSYAPSRMATNTLKAEPYFDESSSNRDHYAYDWSYVVNGQLWDPYYFSTIPQTATAEEWAAIVEGVEPLPNPRLRLHQPEGLTLTQTLLTDASTQVTAETVAGFQMLEGSFNVNSIDKDAWMAFLASNSNLEVPIYDSETGTISGSENESAALFFRTPIPYQKGADTEQSDYAFWNTYRKLTSDELETLAEAIIEEVKARGPFSSVSDFVNRRLSGAMEERQRGALQAALDKTVNASLSNDLVGTVKGADLALPDYPSEMLSDEDSNGTGIPGWILQGDILQVLGPMITVRSDTFRIRAYGEAKDPLTGKPNAQAWCEAIVQRVPDPVGAVGDMDELRMPSSMQGRQFRIIAFRWLNQEEI